MADEIERGPSSPSGSVVRPIYSVRQMRCYSVTESELQQIGLAHLGMTVSVGIGSALIAFGIDLFKDVLLEDKIPAQTQLIVDSLQWIAVILGLIFYVIAGVAWFWRRGMLNTIRSESHDNSTPAAAPMATPATAEVYGTITEVDAKAASSVRVA